MTLTPARFETSGLLLVPDSKVAYHRSRGLRVSAYLPRSCGCATVTSGLAQPILFPLHTLFCVRKQKQSSAPGAASKKGAKHDSKIRTETGVTALQQRTLDEILAEAPKKQKKSILNKVAAFLKEVVRHGFSWVCLLLMLFSPLCDPGLDVAFSMHMHSVRTNISPPF